MLKIPGDVEESDSSYSENPWCSYSNMLSGRHDAGICSSYVVSLSILKSSYILLGKISSLT